MTKIIHRVRNGDGRDKFTVPVSVVAILVTVILAQAGALSIQLGRSLERTEIYRRVVTQEAFHEHTARKWNTPEALETVTDMKRDIRSNTERIGELRLDIDGLAEDVDRYHVVYRGPTSRPEGE